MNNLTLRPLGFGSQNFLTLAGLGDLNKQIEQANKARLAEISSQRALRVIREKFPQGEEFFLKSADSAKRLLCLDWLAERLAGPDCQSLRGLDYIARDFARESFTRGCDSNRLLYSLESMGLFKIRYREAYVDYDEPNNCQAGEHFFEPNDLLFKVHKWFKPYIRYARRQQIGKITLPLPEKPVRAERKQGKTLLFKVHKWFKPYIRYAKGKTQADHLQYAEEKRLFRAYQRAFEDSKPYIRPRRGSVSLTFTPALPKSERKEMSKKVFKLALDRPFFSQTALTFSQNLGTCSNHNLLELMSEVEAGKAFPVSSFGTAASVQAVTKALKPFILKGLLDDKLIVQPLALWVKQCRDFLASQETAKKSRVFVPQSAKNGFLFWSKNAADSV